MLAVLICAIIRSPKSPSLDITISAKLPFENESLGVAHFIRNVPDDVNKSDDSTVGLDPNDIIAKPRRSDITGKAEVVVNRHRFMVSVHCVSPVSPLCACD